LVDDWITLEQACTLLGVSRPTLNTYRTSKKLIEIRLGGRIRLSKTDIIKKIILQHPVDDPLDITIFSNPDFKQIQPLPGIFDLRRFRAIDAHGVMTLLCSIKYHLKSNETNTVYLILDDSFGCSYLESIGFFTEVMRAHKDRIFSNLHDVKLRPQTTRAAVILPLHLIGYRGAEKKILEELYDPLLKQGFSEGYCGHIGWIIGELCDNAHTHSKGPCYLIIEGLQNDSTQTRYLCIALGDTGIGIPTSLKTNPKYASFDDRTLLPLAFKSEVSRMEVEPKRGKGLNDVISVAKGNKSWLRADSNQHGLFFDFRNPEDKVTYSDPKIDTMGTRFCLVLIDNEFSSVSRDEVNAIMSKFMETA
jgi:excisionase family DNA binding protein